MHRCRIFSNMNAIFVVSATIYCIGFIISSNICLGSPNLIEIVEEWGCYDSEIRLTCGHLDSKIAILQATFSPNCTQEECLKGDLKRLIRNRSSAKKVNSRSAETEAARRFLETLRASDINSNAELVDVETHNPENFQTIPHANYLIGAKQKRTSLRASLERLIVKFLRQISPSEHFEEFGKRLKRFRRALLSEPESDDDPNEVAVETKTNRVVIATRNISIENYEMRDRAGSSEERYRKYYESRSYCPDQKRKIGTLTRLEIDETLKKQNDTRHNIRKLLNKRCSGKNHCSFLYAADDPLAILWDSGLVYIKYVCMDDYHTNHYCNEHLTIGHDNSLKRRQVQGEPRAEARVQPRDQVFHSVKILKTADDVEVSPSLEEEMAKQRKTEKLQKARKKQKGIYSQDFKVLKILPSNLDDFNDIEEIGDEIYFRTDEAAGAKGVSPFPFEPSTHQESKLPVPRSTAVYLSNLDNSVRVSGNDETRNGDLSKFENITILIREGEQYFVTFPKPRILDNITANESVTSMTTTSVSSTSFSIPPISQTTANSTLSSSSPSTTSQSSISHLPLPSTIPPALIIATTITTTAAPPPPPQLPATEDIPASADSSMTTVESVTIGERFDSEILSPKRKEEMETTDEQDIETAAPTVGELSMEAASNQQTTVVNGVDESSFDYEEGGRIDGEREDGRDDAADRDETPDGDDDDSEESVDPGYYGVTVRKQYKSIQRTHYGPPKPQGFTMTPGYPKFYIGDCECKWKILAPVSQKIRLTILDISLRTEKNCQDYLQIVDLQTGKNLFKSCEEPNWPIEIVSTSNQVEILVKAATKFAYPKRGVLIHYSALGCLTPSPPMYGRFVERNESLATFECEPSFVFPDSTISTRQLWCTDKHIWNDTVPDCVEEDAVSGSGIVSDINYHLHKTQSTTSAEMGHAETDTVFDTSNQTTTETMPLLQKLITSLHNK